jgi:hypothetical protein
MTGSETKRGIFDFRDLVSDPNRQPLLAKEQKVDLPAVISFAMYGTHGTNFVRFTCSYETRTYVTTSAAFMFGSSPLRSLNQIGTMGMVISNEPSFISGFLQIKLSNDLHLSSPHVIEAVVLAMTGVRSTASFPLPRVLEISSFASLYLPARCHMEESVWFSPPQVRK